MQGKVDENLTKKKIVCIIEEDLFINEREMSVENINNAESNESVKDAVDKALDLIKKESPETIQKAFTMKETTNALKNMEDSNNEPSTIEEALQKLKNTPANRMKPAQAQEYVKLLIPDNILQKIKIDEYGILAGTRANTFLKNIRDVRGKDIQIDQNTIKNDPINFSIFLFRLSRGLDGSQNHTTYDYDSNFKKLLKSFYNEENGYTQNDITKYQTAICDFAVGDKSATSGYSESYITDATQNEDGSFTIDGTTFKKQEVQDVGNGVYKIDKRYVVRDGVARLGVTSNGKNSFRYKNESPQEATQSISVDKNFKGKFLDITLNISGLDFANPAQKGEVIISFGDQGTDGKYILTMDKNQGLIAPDNNLGIKYENGKLSIPQELYTKDISITTKAPKQSNDSNITDDYDEVSCIYASPDARIAKPIPEGKNKQSNENGEVTLNKSIEENIQNQMTILMGALDINNGKFKSPDLHFYFTTGVDKTPITGKNADQLKASLQSGTDFDNIKRWSQLFPDLFNTIANTTKAEDLPSGWDESERDLQIKLMQARLAKLLNIQVPISEKLKKELFPQDPSGTNIALGMIIRKVGNGNQISVEGSTGGKFIGGGKEDSQSREVNFTRGIQEGKTTTNK